MVSFDMFHDLMTVFYLLCFNASRTHLPANVLYHKRYRHQEDQMAIESTV
jgi:hypothetical protein